MLIGIHDLGMSCNLSLELSTSTHYHLLSRLGAHLPHCAILATENLHQDNYWKNNFKGILTVVEMTQKKWMNQLINARKDGQMGRWVNIEGWTDEQMETDTWIERELIEGQTDRDRQTDWLTDWLTERWTRDWQTDRQTKRQTDRLTECLLKCKLTLIHKLLGVCSVQKNLDSFSQGGHR